MLRKVILIALMLSAAPLLSNDKDTVWMKWLGTSRAIFTPDDERIIAFSNPIMFFETETGKLLDTIPYFKTGELTADGKLITLTPPKNPVLWDINTYSKIRDFAPYYKGIASISIARNNRVASIAGDNHSFVIWDAGTGEVLDSVEYGWLDKEAGIRETVEDVKITPDGKYYIAKIYKLIKDEKIAKE